MRAGIALALIALATPAQTATLSYLPKSHIEQFVVQNFDITSIRASTGPKRQLGDRHFSNLGVRVARIETNHIALNLDGWRYDIRILERRDINGDGIEDIAICFTDDGRDAGGSYYTVDPYVLTRYSRNGPLIAIAFDPGERDSCRRSRNAP